MRLSLTREQKRAAANDAGRAYIEAGPGTGKTTVASERYGVIRYGGGRDGRGVVALSFARSARGELETRVRQRWGGSALRWPHKASTLDSLHRALVSHLLRNEEVRWPGGHKELTVLDTWRGQPGARPLTPDFLYCRVAKLNGRTVTTAGVHIGRAINGYGNKKPHEAMLADGICTHDEIRNVLRDALSNTQLREVIADYLRWTTRAVIVDEVFDGNSLDLEIVKVAAETGIPTTLIGDPWQALYEFRGAEPELVPGVITDLGFQKFPVTESFRFQTDEMKSLAEQLRTGTAVQLAAGTPADADVVLASQWRPLWDISVDVLPFAFGQINNRTDAAMALLLEPLASARFGQPPRASLEAAVALGLDPDVSRDELSDALAPVLDRLALGTVDDATEALSLLRTILRDIGGRNIPALSATKEAKRIELLLALSKRLGRSHLVPGMTVHQAKGREWNSVSVHLTPGQTGRLATGLMQDQAGDRAIYVALTRARERVRLA
jgi:DNA helicase-2/ATP-dependent DNA helicase PcrA